MDCLVWLALGAKDISLICEVWFGWPWRPGTFPYNVRFGLAGIEGREICYGLRFGLAGSVGQGDLLVMCGLVWLALGAREIS